MHRQRQDSGHGNNSGLSSAYRLVSGYPIGGVKENWKILFVLPQSLAITMIVSVKPNGVTTETGLRMPGQAACVEDVPQSAVCSGGRICYVRDIITGSEGTEGSYNKSA